MKILDKPLTPMWKGICRVHRMRSAIRLNYLHNQEKYKKVQKRRYESKKKKLCQCGCGKLCVNKFIKGHFEGTEDNRKRLMNNNPASSIYGKSQVKEGLKRYFTEKNGVFGEMVNDGYRYILKKDHPHATMRGYVCEHRLVMEKKLRRYLDSDEIIHHIDENKLNNDIENLELMSLSEHSKKHFEMKSIKERGDLIS